MTATSRRVHLRDAVAAATVWLPFLVFVVTLIVWWDALPSMTTFRNDVSPSAAASLPLWVVAVGAGVVLIGVGFGAISVVPEGPNLAKSRRVPLFWAGAIAGFVCAGWVIQAWVTVALLDGPLHVSNGLLGFATLGAGLYGLIPFFVTTRPPSGTRDAEYRTGLLDNGEHDQPDQR